MISKVPQSDNKSHNHKCPPNAQAANQLLKISDAKAHSPAQKAKQ